QEAPAHRESPERSRGIQSEKSIADLRGDARVEKSGQWKGDVGFSGSQAPPGNPLFARLCLALPVGRMTVAAMLSISGRRSLEEPGIEETAQPRYIQRHAARDLLLR